MKEEKKAKIMTIEQINKIIWWANKKKLRLQELYDIEITRTKYRWYDVSYYWWEYLIDTDDYQYKKDWWDWYVNDYLSEHREKII